MTGSQTPCCTLPVTVCRTATDAILRPCKESYGWLSALVVLYVLTEMLVQTLDATEAGRG